MDPFGVQDGMFQNPATFSGQAMGYEGGVNGEYGNFGENGFGAPDNFDAASDANYYEKNLGFRDLWSGDAPQLPELCIVLSARSIPREKESANCIDKPIYSLAILGPGDTGPRLKTEKIRGETHLVEFEKCFLIPGFILTEQAQKDASLTFLLRKETVIESGPNKGVYHQRIAEARIPFRHLLQDALTSDIITSRMPRSAPSFHAFRCPNDPKFDKQLNKSECFLQIESCFTRRLNEEIPPWEVERLEEEKKQGQSAARARREETKYDGNGKEILVPFAVSKHIRQLTATERFEEERRKIDEQENWNMMQKEKQELVDRLAKEKKDERKARRQYRREDMEDRVRESAEERALRFKDEAEFRKARIESALEGRAGRAADSANRREQALLDRKRDGERHLLDLEHRNGMNAEERENARLEREDRREQSTLDREREARAKDREHTIRDLLSARTRLKERGLARDQMHMPGRPGSPRGGGKGGETGMILGDFVRGAPHLKDLMAKKSVSKNYRAMMNTPSVDHWTNVNACLGPDEVFDHNGVPWKSNPKYLPPGNRGEGGGEGGGARFYDEAVEVESEERKKQRAAAIGAEGDYYQVIKNTRIEIARIAKIISQVEEQHRQYPTTLEHINSTIESLQGIYPSMRQGDQRGGSQMTSPSHLPFVTEDEDKKRNTASQFMTHANLEAFGTMEPAIAPTIFDSAFKAKQQQQQQQQQTSSASQSQGEQPAPSTNISAIPFSLASTSPTTSSRPSRRASAASSSKQQGLDGGYD